MKAKLRSLPLVLVLMASVCSELSTEEVILAKNDSPERVEVSYLLDDIEEILVPVIAVGSSPRLREAITGQCTEGVLIARYLDGEEVERRDPGVCVGTVWHINGDPTD